MQDKRRDIVEFLYFLKGLWGSLAALTVLFPFFNRLVDALPTPYAYRDLFAAVASISAAFGLLLAYTLRIRIATFPYWRVKLPAILSGLVTLACLFGYFGYVLENDVIDRNRVLEARDSLNRAGLSQLVAQLQKSGKVHAADLEFLQAFLNQRMNIGSMVDRMETAIMLILNALIFFNLSHAFARFAVAAYVQPSDNVPPAA
jgi:hypothetical protein